MAGSGVEIGENVLVLYNDPTPLSIRSLGVTSKVVSSSDWIIPGYYYPLRRFNFHIFLLPVFSRLYCTEYDRLLPS